jgi:hypothetical protein
MRGRGSIIHVRKLHSFSGNDTGTNQLSAPAEASARFYRKLLQLD